MFFHPIFYQNAYKQCSDSTREHNKSWELPGPLSGPWTPNVRDVGLNTCDVCARTWSVAPPPPPPLPHENHGSAPAYSPDLAPSHYLCFPTWKKKLTGKQYRTDYKVIRTTCSWGTFLTEVVGQDESLYITGIQALQHWWKKCVDRAQGRLWSRCIKFAFKLNLRLIFLICVQTQILCNGAYVEK